MSRRPDRRVRDKRYPLRFGIGALGLVATTLVLVLFVLPQRYILSSGFVESGLSFPDARTPFAPDGSLRVGARLIPAVQLTSFSAPVSSLTAAPGPAETLWSTVLPLLAADRFADALPHFERYVASYPADTGARREFGRTLVKSGRGAEGVRQLEATLPLQENAELRLELARVLRDLGRVADASAHYALLQRARPNDESLALEWAQSFSWLEQYTDAERVILSMLNRNSGLVSVRFELARLYYYTNRLREASGILETFGEYALEANNALRLRNDIRAALTVPNQPSFTAQPVSLVQRAATARVAGATLVARAQLDSAVRENPNDAAAWLALANLRQYELADYAGARSAIMQLDRLGVLTDSLRLRLAQMDVWTGNRLRAAAVYRDVLRRDSANATAQTGLQTIRTDVSRDVSTIEQPHTGPQFLGTGDTDDYSRLDAVADWVGVRGDWVWSARAGQRWLRGRDLIGQPADRTGVFAEVSPAKWWRLGTIRTSVSAGVQSILPGTYDVSLGAAVRVRGASGATAGVEYRREPGDVAAGTMQSVFARLTQSRVTATLDLPIDQQWYFAAQGEVARLTTDSVGGPHSSNVVRGVASLSKTMSDHWSVGMTSMASAYSRPAPVAGGRRLFWDPALSVAGGPFARITGPLGDRWRASLRVNPGIAIVDEHDGHGGTVSLGTVPQLSGEAGLAFKGRDLSAALDLFYSQARADAYRIFGIRFSVSGASWLSERAGK